MYSSVTTEDSDVSFVFRSLIITSSSGYAMEHTLIVYYLKLLSASFVLTSKKKTAKHVILYLLIQTSSYKTRLIK